MRVLREACHLIRYVMSFETKGWKTTLKSFATMCGWVVRVNVTLLASQKGRELINFHESQRSQNSVYVPH